MRICNTSPRRATLLPPATAQNSLGWLQKALPLVAFLQHTPTARLSWERKSGEEALSTAVDFQSIAEGTVGNSGSNSKDQRRCPLMIQVASTSVAPRSIFHSLQRARSWSEGTVKNIISQQAKQEGSDNPEELLSSIIRASRRYKLCRTWDVIVTGMLDVLSKTWPTNTEPCSSRLFASKKERAGCPRSDWSFLGDWRDQKQTEMKSYRFMNTKEKDQSWTTKPLKTISSTAKHENTLRGEITADLHPVNLRTVIWLDSLLLRCGGCPGEPGSTWKLHETLPTQVGITQ